MSNKKKILINEFLKILNINDLNGKKNLKMKEVKSWDSLNHIKLILSLQKKFGKSVNSSQISSLNSFLKLKKFFLKD
jgi:acyl carrier protein